MSATKTSIFLTGATGYIGGTVLTRLLAHPNASAFDITVLVRSAEKAKLLESLGLRAVVGTHSDSDKLESLSEKAHVVFNTAESDNVPMMEAILRGLKKRHDTTGDVPVLIHTWGTGLLLDNSQGKYATDKVYSDLDIAKTLSSPNFAPRRNVDLLLVDADRQGYARTYIILPATIYGLTTGPLVDAQIQHMRSIQIPILVGAALGRKQGGVIGEGKSIWNSVHVDDVASLYITLYDHITAHPGEAGHGQEGYYFAENGEHTWLDISKRISENLAELGIGSSEPTQFTEEEKKTYFPNDFLITAPSGNARAQGDRARSIGWKPVYTTKDMLDSIKPLISLTIG